VVPSLMP